MCLYPPCITAGDKYICRLLGKGINAKYSKFSGCMHRGKKARNKVEVKKKIIYRTSKIVSF